MGQSKGYLDLPKKDENGISYLSYSQIQLFKRDKNEYLERYILNKPFLGNAYTDFGSKVGEALETNNFKGFSSQEQRTLNKCTRLDEFEKKVNLDFGDFYVLGYIDTNSEDEYTQLCYYALALKQEFGVLPSKAYVNFIRRNGNAFNGEALTLGIEVLKLEVDISLSRVTKVYNETKLIAKEIESFYKQNK